MMWIWLIASLVAAGLGLFTGFAAGMSPIPNDQLGKQGCFIAAAGLLSLFACLGTWIFG